MASFTLHCKLTILVLLSVLETVWTIPHQPATVIGSRQDERSATNRTSNTTELLTWWHNTGEINTQTPVQDGNVRQSHLFIVQVAASSTLDFYDSFVYESIPRNGNGQICIPGDLSSYCDIDDQISIESSIGVTMSWSQYVTNGDSVIRVSRADNGPTTPNNTAIRPTTLNFDLQSDGDSLLITVPYSSKGYRFSVEFQDNLWTYRNAGRGENSHYVQNVNPNGANYVESCTDDMPIPTASSP